MLIFQEYSFISLRVRKHNAWIGELNWAICVLTQAAFHETYWLWDRIHLNIRREKFYQKPKILAEDPEPFTLKQIGLAFAILGGGVLASLIAFGIETAGRRGDDVGLEHFITIKEKQGKGSRKEPSLV